MSDEDYNKLPMNVKKFKKELKKNNPEFFQKKEDIGKVVTDPEHEKDLADKIKKE